MQTSHYDLYWTLTLFVFLGLPVDLQYLPEDKKREADPDVRKMLLETLMLVKTTSRI